jgi:hypothetical protein
MKIGYPLLAIVPYIFIIIMGKIAKLLQLSNSIQSILIGLTVGLSVYSIAKLGLFNKKMNFHAGMAIIIFGPLIIFMIDVYIIK